MKKLTLFAKYIRPHKKLFFLDMAFSVLVAVIDLVFPIVSRWSLQELIPNSLFKAFFAVMAVLFVSYIVKAILQYLVTVIGHKMGTLVEADMRRDIFTHMQSLSFSYYDKNRTGELLGRITNDLFEIVELAHHGPENILVCSLTFIGSIIILTTINLPLSMVLLLMVPITLFVTGKHRRAMQETNVSVKKETGRINAAIESSISGIRTAKAFANEEAEENKFLLANEAFKATKIDYYKAMGRFMGSMEASVGIMQASVIAVGGYLLMVNKLDYIDLITFTLYVSTFTTPIRKFGLFLEIYSQGMAGFSRFTEVMNTKPDINDKKDAPALSGVKGHITYDNVGFAYDNGKTVLSGINLDIAPGKTLALVGPSGEGKTTICSLLMRFYDVSSGSVKIDGMDIRDVTQESLHKNIGIIQQDVFIFAGSIMDNIRYGRPDATDEEVIKAAKLANIHDEIMEIPGGYSASTGERGVVLSGGQKQRISIARVILKNPPILILDEATSALDSVTEAKIQKAIDDLSKERTCIIIAHRLSTIRNADSIGVVDGGNIIEQGSRDELLLKNGAYAALERAQNS